MILQKDNAHTPQHWQAFWEEYVRPRYLRRKAKQTRKAASAENSASKPESHTLSPSKRLDAPSPSVFSPFAKSHLKARALSRSPSYHPESPSMQLTGRALFQEAFASPKKEEVPTMTARNGRATQEATHAISPSYQPGTPSMQLTGRALFQEASKSPSKAAVQIPTSQAVQAARGFVQAEKEARSPPKQTKRKYIALEEEIPSSSPLQTNTSPKRRRQSPAGLPLEIASTPEGSPLHRHGRHYSPLVLDYEEQADEYAVNFENNLAMNESPLGQQLSDTLSDPGHRLDDTQSVFRATTQPLDLDVPPPEEGWGDLEEDGEWDDAGQHILETEGAGISVVDEDEELGLRLLGEAEDLAILVPDGSEELEDDGKWEDGDLEVPETEQHGFQVHDERDALGDDEDSGPDGSQSESHFDIAETRDRQTIIQETQALLREPTEPPDFSIAEPDGGWENLISPSPPPVPSSPHAESETSSVTNAQLDVWIREQAVEGVTEEQAAWVLKCTSMNTELAEEVVKYLAQNGEIPQRRRGVWTELDDENLQSTDARYIQRLEDKHGKDEIKRRWEFHESWAEV